MFKFKPFLICLTLASIVVLNAKSSWADTVVQTNGNADIVKDEVDRSNTIESSEKYQEDELEDALKNPADAYDRDLVEGNAEPGNEEENTDPLDDRFEGSVDNTNWNNIILLGDYLE